MRHHQHTSRHHERPERSSRDRNGSQEGGAAEISHESNQEVQAVPAAEVSTNSNRESRRTGSEVTRRLRRSRHHHRHRHRRRRWSSRSWSWWRRGYHLSGSNPGEGSNNVERRHLEYAECREERRSSRRLRSHRRRRRRRRRSRSRRHWRRRSWSRPRATRSRINALKGAGDAGPRFLHNDDDVS